MFTIFQAVRNRLPLTEIEKKHLFARLNAWACKDPSHCWILSTNYQRLDWYFSPSMTPENGVMGCADPFHDAVYLMQEPHREISQELRARFGGGYDRFWIDRLLPIAVHELRHIRQFRRSKVIYTILSIPFIREFTLERDARAHTPSMEWEK